MTKALSVSVSWASKLLDGWGRIWCNTCEPDQLNLLLSNLLDLIHLTNKLMFWTNWRRQRGQKHAIMTKAFSVSVPMVEVGSGAILVGRTFEAIIELELELSSTYHTYLMPSLNNSMEIKTPRTRNSDESPQRPCFLSKPLELASFSSFMTAR